MVLVPLTVAGDATLTLSAKFPPKPRLLAFLVSTVEWYRYFSVEQKMATDPTDLLFLQDNRAVAGQVVKLSFTFARAAAANASASIPAPDPQADQVSSAAGPAFQHLIAFEGESESAALQAARNLEQLQQRRALAGRADRNRIDIEIAYAQSQASLLQSMSTTLLGLREFIRATDANQTDGTDLQAFVDGVEQTLPEISPADSPATPIGSAQIPNAAALSPRATSGILGTISQVSSLRQKRRTIDEAINRTVQLAQTSQSFLTPLAAELNVAFQDPGLLALESTDLSALQKQTDRLKSLMSETEKTSPAITALAKQRILLNLYKSHLAEWRKSAQTEYHSAWEKLVLQMAGLCGAIAIVIALNGTVRRITSGHVHDVNSRHAVLIGQRIFFWLSIGVIVFSAFAFDLKSLATFLGIASAGLAVAMQNVILAVAGYFFLVGKLHIRVGDRIEISGVSGEVVEIGLMQFRLRELSAARNPPTGRIVSFSNSFMFVSPATGLFKHNEVLPNGPESGPDGNGWPSMAVNDEELRPHI